MRQFLMLLVLLTGSAARARAESPPTFINNIYAPGFDHFDQISQMTLGPDGRVYIADAYRNRIMVYNVDGTYSGQFGSAGSGAGFLGLPSGIAFDAAGNIYVAEQSNARIQKFSASFVPLGMITVPGSAPAALNSPTNLAFSPDKQTLYVTELLAHRVSMFDLAGNLTGRIGGPLPGAAPGNFSYPFGIVVDAAGDVFVADQRNHRIQHFTATGAFVGSWGTFGTGPGQFDNVVGLGLDTAGDFYATDQLNNRVQKFHHDGSFVTEWGSFGSGAGQFHNPWCVLPITTTRVWVGDTYNYRIGVFETLATPAVRESWGAIKHHYR